MIKPDSWIRKTADRLGIIEPYEGGSLTRNTHGQQIFSYGTSSYGYDVRCAPEFKIFSPALATVVDPKSVDEAQFVEHKGDYCIIPPHGMVLSKSMEYIRMPVGVMGLCVAKGSYTRCGIGLHSITLEPGWEGHVALTFFNTLPSPVKIYAHEGAGQILFMDGKEVSATSYASRRGKYQGERGVCPTKM